MRASARGRRAEQDGVYEAETRGFVVRVRPSYLVEQSVPEEHRFVWAYRVEIENRSDEPAQLISRHWIITDAAGRVEEVKGLGVVGEQPTIQPGDSFTYSSGCPLQTPSGVMVGRYLLITDSGDRFEIDIPAFSLDLPGSRRVLN